MKIISKPTPESMTALISQLTSDDLKIAYTIEKLSHRVPWSEKTLLSNQGDRYLNYKIQLADNMVGFAICQVVADEATLFNIAIHPSYQQQGYGKILLQYLIGQLETRNITTLWLEVRESNASAIGLYQSLGFNELTIRKNYYPILVNGRDNGRENALIMAYTFTQ